MSTIDSADNFMSFFNRHSVLIKMDPSGDISFVNDKFCEVFKCSREEIHGQNFTRLCSDLHSENFFQDILVTLKKGNTWQGQLKNRALDREEFWIHAIVSPLLDSQGELLELIGLIFVVNDVNETLWQKNATLETIFRNFPAAIHETIINENWTMSYVSPYIETISGYHPDELVRDRARSFSSIVHKEDLQVAERKVVESLQKNQPYNVRYRIITAHGEERWIQERGALSWEEGKIVGAMFDITEEIELRQTLEGYQKGLEATAIIVFTDEKGVITWVNDRFCDISKYSREELIGKTHRLINSGHHPKDFFRNMWETISSGNAWHGHVRNRAKDGIYYWVDTTIAPIMEGNKIKKYVAFRYDITAQKQKEFLETEISVMRSRFIKLSSDRKKFFDYLLAKVIELTESEYGFIGEVIYGEEGKQLRSFSMTDISWNEDTKKLYQETLLTGMIFKNPNTLIGEVMATGKPLMTNAPSTHPAAGGPPFGHPALKSYMGVPIFHAGEVIAMIGMANRPGGYDERFSSELSILFDAVGEMISAFLKEEELQRQKSITMHNARLASIGHLAAGVGHEINNPLAIVIGYLSISEKILEKNGHLNETLRDMFAKMRTANGRITNIVKGLRTFARSDEIQKNAFDLNEVIHETLFMLSDIYQKEGVNLTFSGPEKAVYMFGSRGRLQQVLVNLIGNAKDATEDLKDRNIKVTLETYGEKIKIVVSDNGHGIPEDIKDKIFDPFFTTKDVNSGTGIGLSLVNSIIKEHEGQIEVDSRPGKGASFTITLPGKLDTSFDKTDNTVAQASSSWIGGTILVVDDEPDIRMLLGHILRPLCEKVVLAEDVSEAIDLVSKHKIDIVISDIKMPRLDGLSFYRNLKASQKLPKFVFITGGVSMDEEEQNFVFENKIKVIPKPFTEKVIFECLRELSGDASLGR